MEQSIEDAIDSLLHRIRKQGPGEHKAERCMLIMDFQALLHRPGAPSTVLLTPKERGVNCSSTTKELI